ncbi:MAG: polysaccharide export protein [Chitinophagaceae bacterium]|nr:polysaccharide export protein [Chitinophagaceae bacterium]
MGKIVSLFVLIGILVLMSGIASGQQLGNQDLSRIKADAISDLELKSYYEKAKAANLTDQQIFDNLAQRGLPISELTELQLRINRFQAGISASTSNGALGNNTNDNTRNIVTGGSKTTYALLDSFAKQIFGMEIFSGNPENFSPDLRMATPPDYVIGPDDQLKITIYGFQEGNYKLSVNSEGNINIPNVGPINVNGLTMEDARIRITRKLASTIYPAINSGRTKVQITLGDIRTIRVIVIGQAKKPGAYNVSSLSTLFNVLYLCGGPAINGSFRNIELIRAGKKIVSLDLYKYLLTGDISENHSLKDNDVIRIPYYETRVKLTGEVKRPGYFESKSEETLPVLLSYAGGYSDSAYTAQLRVLQVGDKERKLTVLDNTEISRYHPQRGDEVIVEKILNRFTNRIILNGAVARPGFYDLTPGITVKQLIERADGIKEDAFTSRATISRLLEDQTRQLIAFNVVDLLSRRSADIPLQREDIVTIPSVFELRGDLNITVEGEVRSPGPYLFKTGMTAKDAILQAGGFTEAATGKRIEVGRRINNNSDTSSLQIANVFNIDTEKDLNISGNSFVLQPFDIVVVRNNPSYFVQRSVTILGEVKYTGKYVLTQKNERVSDVIMRAGGLTDLSDARAASLKRINKLNTDTSFKANTLKKLGFDTTAYEGDINKMSDLIGMNLNTVLERPHTPSDVILEDGDIITVPKRDAVVKVRGEVLFPTQLSFMPGEKLLFYINRAGGFSDKAARKKAYLIAANGNGKRTRHFLFFRKYPRVEPGDEVFVPKMPEKKGLSTGEVIGIASGLASLAGVVIAILNATK